MGINSGSKRGGGGKDRQSGRTRRQLPVPATKPNFRPIENPFPEKKDFRLGIFKIIEEKDDYLICRGYDPNAKDPFAYITPSAPRKVKVAKPPLLQRTAWEDVGQEEIPEATIDGITYTYTYSDEEYGVRTAHWTDDDDEEQEREERIDIPYLVNDFLLCAQINEDREVGGIDVESEAGGRLTWMDLNASGRHWKAEAETLETVLRLGKHASDIAKGASAEFTLYDPETELALDPAETQTATSLLKSYQADTWAVIGLVEGEWIVVEYEDDEHPAIWGTLDGTLSDGGSATLSIFVWNGSAWADGGENETVYEILGIDDAIASGTRVWAEWEDSRGVYGVTSVSCKTV